jgi:hypothetical protein
MAEDLKAFVIRYLEASNRHDLATLRLMTGKDATWQLGPDLLVGRDAVVGPNAWDAGLNTRLQWSNIVVKGNVVEFELIEHNDLLDALGLDLRHVPRFVIEGGLVGSPALSVVPSASPPAFRAPHLPGSRARLPVALASGTSPTSAASPQRAALQNPLLLSNRIRWINEFTASPQCLRHPPETFHQNVSTLTKCPHHPISLDCIKTILSLTILGWNQMR